eukprot:jgi/Astpho2/5014/Aster-05948
MLYDPPPCQRIRPGHTTEDIEVALSRYGQANLAAPAQAPSSTPATCQVLVNVTNPGGAAIAVPFSVDVTNPAYLSALSAINWQYNGAVQGGTISGTVTQYFLSLLPSSINTISLGLVVEANTNASSLAPYKVSIAGSPCQVSVAAPAPPPPPSGGAIESSGTTLSTSGGQIVANGQPVAFKGINWFGFDDGNTFLDGLWEGSTQLTQDFATIVYRLQLLGFNAVRLPFSFQYTLNKTPSSQTRTCGQVTPDVVLNSVTAPGATVTSATVVPTQPNPPPQTPGVCSDYVPNDSGLNRLAYTAQFFANNGFYVLLDNQLNLDNTVLTQGTQTWVSYWVELVQACSQDPVTAGRLMIDILNEPDVVSMQWSAQNGVPGYGDLALAAMDALYPVNNNLLFFIEGCGQAALVENWGDGIATDPSVLQEYGISSPRPFFEQVITRPYVAQVVVAPHVYPPSISTATDRYSGAPLWLRLSQSFGYLNKAGYCADSGQCTQFAVVIGETGTAFQDPRDAQCMSDFSSYLNNAGAANDGLHNAIPNVFWWAWNANSGDTGGLVDTDWTSILWNKINWLQTVGLVPWYAYGQAAPSSTPETSANSSSGAGIEDFTATTSTADIESFSPNKYAQAGAGDSFQPKLPSAEASSGVRTESQATSGLTTANGTILGVDGVPVALKGVIWHGFDNGNTMLSGLDMGSTSLSRNFATQVQRIIALGFNTVKVPFSFNDLYGLVPNNYTESCTQLTAQQLQDSLTNPNVTVPPGRTVPNLTDIVTQDPGICNAYLPSSSTIDRFLFVIQFLAGNGLYVILDNDLAFDKTVLDPAQWLMSWATLVSAASTDTATRARLLVDLLDTPDTVGLSWDAANGLPGASDLYIAAMEALYPINPAILFLVEGTAQPQFVVNQGDGFVTSVPLIEATGASNPSTFFRTLLTKPYAQQVIVAPHVLPPSISGNNATGQALFTRLSTSFGYLNYQGFCANIAASYNCKNFPVMIGSFGSALTSPLDVQFMNDLSDYLANAGSGNDGAHRQINSFIWNSWTPDVAVTGGILDVDYASIVWPKINYLASPNLGLLPWYSPPTGNRGRGGYVNSTSSLAPTDICAANVSVTLKDSAAAPIFTPWTLTVENSNYTSVTSSFGLNLTNTGGGKVSGQANDYYNILWPSGTNNVTVNFVVESSFEDLRPTGVSINGIACQAALVAPPPAAAAAVAPSAMAAAGPNAAPAAVATAVESLNGGGGGAPAQAVSGAISPGS